MFLLYKSCGLLFLFGFCTVTARLRLPPLHLDIEPEELAEVQWFTQKLDHFTIQDPRQWNQRYWISWKNYKAGGPILLMIGGEGEENPRWLEGGAWLKYAQDNGAAMMILEHRFYGKSRPLPTTSTKNLSYLSSRQALSDLANFIKTTSTGYKLTGKWVVIGGSYPGALAAWLRLKYPHLVAGAVSTSGPLHAQADFPEYLEVVNTALAETANKCDDATKKAIDQLNTMLGNDVKKVSEMFRLCAALDSKLLENDKATLIEGLLGNIESIVQYNRDNRAFFGGEWQNITTDTVCDLMIDVSLGNELARFAAVNELALKMSGATCFEARYSKKVELLRMTNYPDFSDRIPGDVGNRPWFYQTCTEFGWYQSSDQQDHPYGKSFPAKFFMKMCRDVFGPRFDSNFIQRGIDATNIEYGGVNIPVTNVVFVQGSLDPWHRLGRFQGSANTTILVPGTAHCANLYPESPEDSPELRRARETVGDFIAQWVQ